MCSPEKTRNPEQRPHRQQRGLQCNLRLSCLMVGLPCSTLAMAQEPPRLRVERIAGQEFSSGFTSIGGIHELRSGAILVLDLAEGSLYRLSLAPSMAQPVARRGSGPREYQRPARLLALTQGRVAVTDPANARILVLDPTGNPIGTIPDASTGLVGSAGLRLSRPTASDSLGTYFAQGPSAVRTDRNGWHPVDSAAIEKWTEGASRRDTVAFVRTPLPRGAVVIGGYVSSEPNPIASLPFRRREAWAVSLDGWVAVVRLSPYRVDMFPPGAPPRQGAPVTVPAISVTEQHKAAWRTERSRSVAQTVYPGGGQAPFSRIVVAGVQEPPDWPKVLPPITEESPRFDSRGRLWVGRSTPAGAAAIYDVFDRVAFRIFQIELPPETRLIGFGPQTMYLLRRDADDLEHLQRYPLPAPRR